MALAEQQDTEKIATIKDSWQSALKTCLPLFKNPPEFLVEYNPANWRISRQLVGLRKVSYIGKPYLIFEFSTPNSILPFDCFESPEAKQGVLAHEIAHMIDDARWNFNLEELMFESNNFITREQRAELLAFAASPVAIYEANKALINSTARITGVDITEFIEPFAAVETLGRIGLERSYEPTSFFYETEKKIKIHRILEEYLSSNIFSLAGIVTPPALNNSTNHGIKPTKNLSLARKEVTNYLKNKITRDKLNKRLKNLGYRVKGITGYDAFQSVDLNNLNAGLCRKNIEKTLKQFSIKQTHHKYFEDLVSAVKQTLARI